MTAKAKSKSTSAKAKKTPVAPGPAPILYTPHGVRKTKAKQAKPHAEDPVELTILSSVDPGDIYYPKTIDRSVATSEQITDILQDINVECMDQEGIKIKNTNALAQKVTLSDDLIVSDIKLTEFDRAVLEGCLACLVSGNPVFSTAMLYRAVTGRSSLRVTPEQRQSVDESMRRLMFTPFNVDLDSTELPAGSTAKYLGTLIPAEALTLNISGTESSAYRILSTPAIYRFCRTTDNMTVTPIELLSVPINYTKRTIVLLNCLQRAVAPIIYPSSGEYKQSPPLKIEYEYLYSCALEYDQTVEDMRGSDKSRIRDTVHTILSEWVKSGFLDSWKDLKKKTIYAVELSFPEAPPLIVPSLPQSPN